MELESSKSLGLSKRHSYQKTRGHAGEGGGGEEHKRELESVGVKCRGVSVGLGGE